MKKRYFGNKGFLQDLLRWKLPIDPQVCYINVKSYIYRKMYLMKKLWSQFYFSYLLVPCLSTRWKQLQYSLYGRQASGGLDGKESACNAGDLGSIPGWEGPLEKGMATYSSILAWRILWTEEPGGLQSMGLQRVRQDSATNTFTFQLMHIRNDRKVTLCHPQ